MELLRATESETDQGFQRDEDVTETARSFVRFWKTVDKIGESFKKEDISAVGDHYTLFKTQATEQFKNLEWLSKPPYSNPGSQVKQSSIIDRLDRIASEIEPVMQTRPRPIKATERLDRIASEIEPVRPDIALAIDRISDRLERFATDIPVTPDQQEALKKDIWPFFKHVFDLREPSSFRETLVEKSGDKVLAIFKTDGAYMEMSDLKRFLQSAPTGLGFNVDRISVEYTPEEFESLTGLKEVK